MLGVDIEMKECTQGKEEILKSDRFLQAMMMMMMKSVGLVLAGKALQLAALSIWLLTYCETCKENYLGHSTILISPAQLLENTLCYLISYFLM